MRGMIWALIASFLTSGVTFASERPNELDARLYQAVVQGDRKQVVALMEQGAEVNQAHRPWELTPLLVGVAVGEAMTDLLIEAGADVNARDREGVSVLMKAVHAGDAMVVERLLQESALEVDAKGPQGNTALTYAVLYGYPKMVEALIERGADVNVRRANGTVPLGLAEHMLGLALAMPRDTESVGTDDAQGSHAHGDHAMAGHADVSIESGPQDHHRSRREAVGSYSRVRVALDQAGALREAAGDRHGHQQQGHYHH